MESIALRAFTLLSVVTSTQATTWSLRAANMICDNTTMIRLASASTSAQCGVNADAHASCGIYIEHDTENKECKCAPAECPMSSSNRNVYFKEANTWSLREANMGCTGVKDLASASTWQQCTVNADADPACGIYIEYNAANGDCGCSVTCPLFGKIGPSVYTKKVWGCTTGSGSACKTCVPWASRTSNADCLTCNEGHQLNGKACQATTWSLRAADMICDNTTMIRLASASTSAQCGVNADAHASCGIYIEHDTENKECKCAPAECPMSSSNRNVYFKEANTWSLREANMGCTGVKDLASASTWQQCTVNADADPACGIYIEYNAANGDCGCSVTCPLFGKIGPSVYTKKCISCTPAQVTTGSSDTSAGVSVRFGLVKAVVALKFVQTFSVMAIGWTEH